MFINNVMEDVYMTHIAWLLCFIRYRTNTSRYDATVHIDIGKLSLALSPRLKVHLWDDDKMADSLRYKDKVIIVTGGSSGIGKGCVKVFGKIQYFINSLLLVKWFCYTVCDNCLHVVTSTMFS